MPRVTVLLSVHNGERHLREAVDSILRQSFGDFEFLILDDGSTDGTPDILRSYDDRRIRLIDNRTNLGLTRTLNRGIRVAQGEFLARQDADDVSAPGRLDKQLSFLDAHRDVALVGTSYLKIDEAGYPLGQRDLPADSTDLRWSLLFYCPFVHSAVMFRLDTVRSEIGLYDETIRYAQDHDLWSRIARRHRVANLSDPLVSYRIADSSMSSTYGKTVDDDHDRIVTGNVIELLGGAEFPGLRVDAGLCRLARAILSGVPQEFDANGIERAVTFLKQLHSSFSAYYHLSSRETTIHRAKVFSQVGDHLVRAAHRFADGDRYAEARQCLAGATAAKFDGIFENGGWRLALKLAAGQRTMEVLRRLRGNRQDYRPAGGRSPKPPTPSKD